jgi:hypothetical protein
MHKIVKLSQLRPSPYRDLNSYPLEQARIDALQKSIQETGFWENLQARPDPTEKGVYQIASGHHRLAAARAVLGEDYEHKIEVGNYGDLQMLRMMAHENSEEYGSTPGHVMLCTKQARALITAKMKQYQTLGLESTAATDHAKRKKGSKAIEEPTDDLSILRDLFSSHEGNYQKSRAAGPGWIVIEKYLQGALGERQIKTALKVLNVSEELGVAPDELIDTTENVSQMDAQVSAIKEISDKVKKSGSKMTSGDVRKVIKKVNAVMEERKKNGKGNTGRRGRRIETAKALQEVAEQDGNPELLNASALEELSAYMTEVPGEIRAAHNRLVKFTQRAKELGASIGSDNRQFGNLFEALVRMQGAIVTALELFGDGMNIEHTEKFRQASKRLDRLTRGLSDSLVTEVTRAPKREAITFDASTGEILN